MVTPRSVAEAFGDIAKEQAQKEARKRILKAGAVEAGRQLSRTAQRRGTEGIKALAKTTESPLLKRILEERQIPEKGTIRREGLKYLRGIGERFAERTQGNPLYIPTAAIRTLDDEIMRGAARHNTLQQIMARQTGTTDPVENAMALARIAQQQPELAPLVKAAQTGEGVVGGSLVPNVGGFLGGKLIGRGVQDTVATLGTLGGVPFPIAYGAGKAAGNVAGIAGEIALSPGSKSLYNRFGALAKARYTGQDPTVPLNPFSPRAQDYLQKYVGEKGYARKGNLFDEGFGPVVGTGTSDALSLVPGLRNIPLGGAVGAIASAPSHERMARVLHKTYDLNKKKLGKIGATRLAARNAAIVSGQEAKRRVIQPAFDTVLDAPKKLGDVLQREENIQKIADTIAATPRAVQRTAKAVIEAPKTIKNLPGKIKNYALEQEKKVLTGLNRAMKQRLPEIKKMKQVQQIDDTPALPSSSFSRFSSCHRVLGVGSFLLDQNIPVLTF